MDISQIMEKNQENIKKAEKILYLGPFLIGWVPGIWLYNFDAYEFKLASTGFLQLIIYSLILTLNHFLAYLDLGGYGNYPLYLDSLLAMAYLAIHPEYQIKLGCPGWVTPIPGKAVAGGGKHHQDTLRGGLNLPTMGSRNYFIEKHHPALY